ncbi:hypothetical protein DFJ77DRAFT_462106 [Powellomyces hirtus]|nr:hypothetical protein DFJ77DRAFT_462106 [Powellomyces hirtus]
MDEEAALEAHAAAERLSQEYLATSRSAADPEARSNWREEQASKDQLSNPAVVPLTQTAKGGHHQSVKDLASDVKKSKQDLAHAKSKESVKATNDETGHARESSSKENLDRKTDSEHEAANHHRSVKELAGDAKQSHDVANSKHILAEHSEQLQQEESAALHKEHHHHSIRELAVEGLVADVKASLQSLTHVGNREHVAKLESPPVHAQADVQHSADPVKDTAVEEPPAETTVPIVAAAHESKVALVDEDTQPTAQHSIKNLLHIGEQKTQDAEAAKHAVAEVGSATHTEEQLGSAAPEHGKEETQHLATLETSVAVDVSKHSHNSANNLSSHHGSKNQLGNTETVQVTGSVDVSPAGVAADPQIRKSAAHLAKDVAHEVRSSARDLQHQVNQADNAESHVSNTTLNKAPTTKSTKSIAKEAVGHTKDKAAEQIQAEQHTATSRPNSASKTRSRPASAKKDASRPTSPPKATSRPASPPKAPSRKGSTTNLKKSPSTNVVKSTATLADRRRSGDAVTKPPTAGVSANNLAEHKASTDALNGKHGSTALAKGSINALHQSLQGDHGFGSRQTLNRTATSPRGSRQNVAQHAGSTNASSNQLAKGTGVKASASNVSKASAQNLSTTPRTSHPIIAQTGTGSVAALADAHTALAQSNRSLAEAKTGAGRSNATLTKTYTTTASTPALNQAGRAGSQNSVKAAGPSSDLQKEPSPQLRSGSQAASRSASASKLDQVEA